MKLYQVTATIDTYLVCEDDPDFDAMQSGAEDEVGDNGFGQGEFHAVEITNINQVPVEIRNTLPYGEGNDGLTLEQWVENIQSAAKAADDPNQMQLPLETP